MDLNGNGDMRRRQVDEIIPSGNPVRRKRRRVAPEERIRATVACASCRRLKEKCNGEVPCDRCIRHSRHCQVMPNEPKDKRGSVPSPKDGILEERLHHLEAIAEHFLDKVPSSNEQLRQLTFDLKSQENGSNDLSSNAADSLNLEREDFTVKRLPRNAVHYSGELSHWNFSEKLRTQLDRGPVHEIDGGNELGVKDFWRADDLRSQDCLQRFSVNSLPPRDVADFLLQMFFDYAMTNTFFVEYEWATEKLRQLYETTNNLGVDDSAWICSTLLILAIGSQFAHMGGGLREAAISVDGASDDAVSLTLYRLAATFLPDVLVLASQDSVQACLLLAHFALPLDSHGLAFSYAGLAIKMAIQNGMHRVYRGTDLSEAEIDLRNRLWWSAYTLELRICVLHGRPNSSNDATKDASLPKDTGDYARCREITLLRLVEWLHEFSKVLHTLQRCAPRLRQESLQRVLTSKRSFEEFWNERPISRGPSMEQCRRSAQLHLYYHLSLVYLCRPFILNRSCAKQQPSNSSQPSVLDSLAEDAVTHACHIIDILAVLDSTIGLARASYIEFSSCRAAGLVVLAASLTNRSEVLALKRTLGIRLIQKMAVTIAASQSDASLLTAIDASIRRMDNEKALDTWFEGDIHNTEDDQAKYDTFKKWASNRQGDQEPSLVPLELDPAISNGADADMQGLFDGFEWNLFDGTFELDDNNMKDLFANFDNWESIQ